MNRDSLARIGGFITWLFERYIIRTTKESFNYYFSRISWTFKGALKMVLGYLLLCGFMVLIWQLEEIYQKWAMYQKSW